MKYVIEIEDEPLVRKSALHGEDAVYRAAGFKSLVFDKVGLEKLEPLQQETLNVAKKNYDKGIEDAWNLAQKIDKLDCLDWESIFGEGYTVGDLSSYSYDAALDKMESYKAHKHKLDAEKEMVYEFCDKTGYSIEELQRLLEEIRKCQ